MKKIVLTVILLVVLLAAVVIAYASGYVGNRLGGPDLCRGQQGQVYECPSPRPS